jgi:hypothetical protein
MKLIYGSCWARAAVRVRSRVQTDDSAMSAAPVDTAQKVLDVDGKDGWKLWGCVREEDGALIRGVKGRGWFVGSGGGGVLSR